MKFSAVFGGAFVQGKFIRSENINPKSSSDFVGKGGGHGFYTIMQSYNSKYLHKMVDWLAQIRKHKFGHE
jgi:hypothetical protein